MKVTFPILAAFLSLAFAACGDKSTPTPATGSNPPAATALEPKDAIAHQLSLLKAGDVEKLKACFTDRQKERITPEAVAQGKEAASKMTLDEMVASVEMGEYEGKKTAKIKMKNNRTLTTLIQTDGRWLADTVWFK